MKAQIIDTQCSYCDSVITIPLSKPVGKRFVTTKFLNNQVRKYISTHESTCKTKINQIEWSKNK